MVSIVIMLFSIFLGYKLPIKIGWVILALSPFMIGLGNFVIYKDSFLPIRWEQLMFAFSFGVAFSKQYRKRVFSVFFNLWPISLLCLYIIVSIVYGLIDPHPTLFKWFILQEYISYLAIVILAFAMIQSFSDLERYVKVLQINLVLILLLVIFEIWTGFSLAHYFCLQDIKYCNLESQYWMRINSEELVQNFDGQVRRYVGYTGSPNLTAIVIAMFSVFWLYSIFKSKNFLSYFLTLIFLSLSIGILIVGQTRAAIFAFILLVFSYSVFYKKLSFLIVPSIFIIIFSYFYFDSLNTYVNAFVENRLASGNTSIDIQRLSALSKSIDLMKEYFLMGCGGTIFSVSERYLNYDDNTGYILHFLVGGIPLGVLYIIFLVSMPYDLLKLKKRIQSKTHKRLIEITVVGLFVGMLTQVFNENSIIFYYLLLYSVARSSLFCNNFPVKIKDKNEKNTH